MLRESGRMTHTNEALFYCTASLEAAVSRGWGMNEAASWAKSFPWGPRQLGKTGIIAVLGFTQCLSWGSSYYLLAVLAKPIAADTGWSLTWVVGGVSLGLLIAGFASPAMGGRLSDTVGGPSSHGGRSSSPLVSRASAFQST